MQKELIPLQKKIVTLSEKVSTLDIISPDSMKDAVTLLSQMNQYADSIKEKKELITKPLNTALKNARLMFLPLETVYNDSIALLREKMSLYQTKIVKEQEDIKLSIVERVKEGRGNLTIETASKKIANLTEPDKEVATDAGLVQFRESKVLKIIDPSLIPDEFWTLDESKLLKSLKEGNTIPGATTETIQIPVNYR